MELTEEQLMRRRAADKKYKKMLTKKKKDLDIKNITIKIKKKVKHTEKLTKKN